MLLRHYLEQGLSKAVIARRLGISRRTLHQWIATGQLDRDLDDKAVRYGPRKPVSCKLDDYRGVIAERLAALRAAEAADRLRALINEPTRLGGMVKVGESY